MNTTALPTWKLPATGRILLALGLAATLGCDAGLKEKPKPATDLTATPEAITLIEDAKDRCVKIASTGLERARTAETNEQRRRDDAAETSRANNKSSPAPAVSLTQETLSKYLDEEAAPEVATVTRAGELIRDLLPQVKGEASAEISEAVRILSVDQEQVCQRVRNPRPTPASYQESLDSAVHDYDTAAAKLATLYTVSATDTQFALSKFNPLLEEARNSTDRRATTSSTPKMTPDQLSQQRKEWDASQELQQQQQAEHDAAVVRWRQRQDGKTPILTRVGVAPELAAKSSLAPEKRQQTMEAWSSRYAGKVAPVRAALTSYLNIRRIGTPEQVQPVCQQLLDATTALNTDAGALDPPDDGAARALRKAYGDLQECARSCVNFQVAEAAFRLAAYQRSLGDATTALQPFNVTP